MWQSAEEHTWTFVDSRRNGPQLSMGHDDDDDDLTTANHAVTRITYPGGMEG